MLNRLNELSFVIGAFFTLVSLILFINALATSTMNALTLYSASTFLVFGAAMMYRRKKKNN